jgi:hypothetical protein
MRQTKAPGINKIQKIVVTFKLMTEATSYSCIECDTIIASSSLSECYSELGLPIGRGNKGKEHVEVIGKVRVCYRFYVSGTVMVFTESSNNPFKLKDEIDRSRIIAFFGQVRDRLTTFLMDRHERIVPDIMEWDLTEFDVNEDIKVSDWFHYAGFKIQIKHLDHIFRIYIKSMGKDTVCRVEESVSNSKRFAIETINHIFNPYEQIKNLILGVDKKLDKAYAISNTQVEPTTR